MTLRERTRTFPFRQRSPAGNEGCVPRLSQWRFPRKADLQKNRASYNHTLCEPGSKHGCLWKIRAVGWFVKKIRAGYITIMPEHDVVHMPQHICHWNGSGWVFSAWFYGLRSYDFHFIVWSQTYDGRRFSGGIFFKNGERSSRSSGSTPDRFPKKNASGFAPLIFAEVGQQGPLNSGSMRQNLGRELKRFRRAVAPGARFMAVGKWWSEVCRQLPGVLRLWKGSVSHTVTPYSDRQRDNMILHSRRFWFP